MKWREVKILCVGMCVCTMMAALSPNETIVPEQNIENMVVTEKLGIESNVEDAELEKKEDIGTESIGEQEIGVERHAVYEVGTGVDESTVDGSDMGENQVDGNAAEGNQTEEITVVESNLIIADVTNYVNIRSLPSEEGEILGKLYNDSVGRKHGEENGWYYIQSGNVIGYVKSEFVLTGEQAEQRAREVGTRLAEVTTTTLKVRKEPTTDSTVLGLVPGGDILGVLEEEEGWVKVEVEDGLGYISTDFAHVYTENVEAESREEEAARLKKEEEARKKAEEAAKEALRQQQALNNQTKPAGTSSSSGNATGNLNTNTTVGNDVTENSNASSLGQQIADYAMQFIGNPYVYGGTSLTNGADCSGFVQSVYKHFGISLPRTSGEQGKAGSTVDGIANARPGDLVWYSGHIGIYIGNNKIVHASSPKNGIITSNANYRTILGIRRIV